VKGIPYHRRLMMTVCAVATPAEGMENRNSHSIGP